MWLKYTQTWLFSVKVISEAGYVVLYWILCFPYRPTQRVARLMTVKKFNDFLVSPGSVSKGPSSAPTDLLKHWEHHQFVDAHSNCLLELIVTAGTDLHYKLF